MVKIRFSSEFLRPEDVPDGTLVTVVNEGHYRSPEETPFGREVFEIRVRLPDGKEKLWTMNKTTQKRMVDAHGDDSRNWIGKKIRIELTKQTVRGELKTVVYGRPVEEELLGVVEAKPPEAEETVTLTLSREEAERLRALLGKK